MSNKNNICKLCLNISVLRNSHIIPEFIYRDIYDNKHTFLEIDTADNKTRRIHQKGVREYLFCDKCEQKMGRWEKYFSENVYREIQYNFESEPNEFILNVDYDKVKLFELSILYRVSLTEKYSQINLGRHKETLRNMLLNENPGKYYEYGCVIYRTSTNILSSSDLIVVQNKIMRMQSYRAVIIMTPIIIFVFIISSHNSQFPLKETFLSLDGKMMIGPKDQATTDWILRSVRDTLLND